VSQLLILIHPELVPGFQLAGVQAFGPPDVESAEELIRQWLREDQAGLLAIDESILAGLAPGVLAELQAGDRLPYLAIPGGGGMGSAMTRRARIAGLLRRAIGIHITFSGEGEEDRTP